MENSNPKSDPQNQTASDQNPNENNENTNLANDVVPNRRARPAFTELSQVDADLALARTLQEQERAYMMLRMESGGGGGVENDSDYGSWETESYGNEEVGEGDYSGEDDEGSDSEQVDAFDANAHTEVVEDGDQAVELDASAFSSDEAYARALQDAEDREMAARLLALTGISGMVVREVEDEEEEDDDDDSEDGSQDPWEDVDPDELTYEELIALGDVVGTESRGLSAETIASLPSVNYKSQGNEEGNNDSCVICRLDYEDDETLTVLSCKHSYHTECIKNWLQINKVCPVCSTEVSTSSAVKS